MSADDRQELFNSRGPKYENYEAIYKLANPRNNIFPGRMRWSLVYPIAIIIGAICAEITVFIYPLAHRCTSLDRNNTLKAWSPNAVPHPRYILTDNPRCNVPMEIESSTLSLFRPIFMEDNTREPPCTPDFAWDLSPVYEYSLVKQLRWVCSRSHYRLSAVIALWLGIIFGGVLSGIMAERHGRMKTFVICCLLNVIFRLATVTATFVNTGLALFALLLYGGSVAPILVLPAIIVSEVSNKEDRTKLFIYSNLFYPMGYWIVMSLFQWHSIMYPVWIGVSTMALVFPLLAYRWHIFYESPRWLFIKGKFHESANILNKIALINKVSHPYPPNYYAKYLHKLWEMKFYETDINVGEVENTFYEGYLRALLGSVSWIINPIIFVFTVTSIDIFNQPYKIAAVAMKVMCGIIIVVLPIKCLVTRVGRRKALSMLYLCGLIIYLGMYLFQDSSQPFQAAFVVVALVLITMTSAVSFMISVELLPSCTRNIHLGWFISLSTVLGGVTFLVRDYIMSNEVIPTHPFMASTILCIVAFGCVSCTLEESFNRLVDTYQDITDILMETYANRD